MIINVHAGHNPDGMKACGAVGLIKESTEARKVKDLVIKALRDQGHTVYDCTCNNGTSQNDVLQKIVAMCNAHAVDLDVSIHFNAGANDVKGNGKTTGVETYVYSSTTKAKPVAERVCKHIAELGFSNRGVKYSKTLYVLKNTKAEAMLIECCFVDDADDVKIYNAEEMANAIVLGITGQAVATPKKSTVTYTTVKTNGKGLNMRSATGSVMCSIPNGTKLVLISRSARTMTINGIKYTMSEVKYNNKTGFVAQTFLC